MVNNDKNLSSGEICPHEKGGDKSVLSQFALFCRKITLFCSKICSIAIYALLCGEKSNHNCVCGDKFNYNCVCGKKITNIRYGCPISVWHLEQVLSAEGLKSGISCKESIDRTPPSIHYLCLHCRA